MAVPPNVAVQWPKGLARNLRLQIAVTTPEYHCNGGLGITLATTLVSPSVLSLILTALLRNFVQD